MKITDGIARIGRFIEYKKAPFIVGALYGAGAAAFAEGTPMERVRNGLASFAIIAASSIGGSAWFSRHTIKNTFSSRETEGRESDSMMLKYTARRLRKLTSPFDEAPGDLPPAIQKKADAYLSDAFGAASRTTLGPQADYDIPRDAGPENAFNFYRWAGDKQVLVGSLPAKALPPAGP